MSITRFSTGQIAKGVTEFTTANVKNFEGVGFRRVWNPLAT